MNWKALIYAILATVALLVGIWYFGWGFPTLSTYAIPISLLTLIIWTFYRLFARR